MGLWDTLFGRKAEPAPDAPPYPTNDEAQAFRAAGGNYASGYENYLSGQRYNNAPRDTDRRLNDAHKQDILTDLHERINTRSTLPPGVPQQKPSTDVADMMTRAYMATRRSAIGAMGFDPSVVGVDTQGGETPYAGFTHIPTGDVWTNIQYPEALTHEFMHRGLDELRKTGTLSPPAQKFLSSGYNDEMTVRELMRRTMGVDEKNTNNQTHQQVKDAKELFAGSPLKNLMLDELEKAAAQLHASRHRGGPR